MKAARILLSVSLISLAARAELPADYQSWTARQKQDFLWTEKLVPSTEKTLSDMGAFSLQKVLRSPKVMLTLGQSFDRSSDEMPAGRPKLLHPFGSVAKFRFEADPSSPYTGVLQGSIGIMRLSLAGDPRQLKSYTPGMALKFLIDGRPSVNIHVMYALDGQGANQNFFANSFSNVIAEPKSPLLKAVKKWFARFVKDPLHVAAEPLGVWTPEGAVIKDSRAPYQIIFKPAGIVKIAEDTSDDFRTELARVAPGTKLYEVYGREKDSQDLVRIGALYTTSEIIASDYGDKQLFFQHSRAK